MCLEIAPFSLDELIAEIRFAHEETISSKGLLAFWPEVQTKVRLLGDALRLKQIVTNLISNAVKFTKEGSVWFNIEVLRENADQLEVRFEVTDTGIGIKEESIPALLEPFTQADSSITRRFGGTGLGLSITDRLIKLMGGQLQIKTTLGMGSSFSFVLTFALEAGVAASCEGLSKDCGKSLDDLNLLLVDDDEGLLDSLAELLMAEGAAVHTASNGRQAYDWLMTNGKTCDAVLMDIQMPVMDGITATRLIRAERSFDHLPIIAVTAGVLPDQQQSALDAGITEMLRKPVDPEVLIERLLGLTR